MKELNYLLAFSVSFGTKDVILLADIVYIIDLVIIFEQTNCEISNSLVFKKRRDKYIFYFHENFIMLEKKALHIFESVNYMFTYSISF